MMPRHRKNGIILYIRINPQNRYGKITMTISAQASSDLHKPLWSPSDVKVRNSQLWTLMKDMESQTGKVFTNYHSFWQWSVENTEDFWDKVWDFCAVIGEKGDVVLENADKMPGAQFFPNSKINFAENLLRRRDDLPAIIFRDEKGGEHTLSFNDLYDQVSRLQQALKDMGVDKGDRVAAYMPNMPETIIACLAVTSLGAIWSSASPDFGVQGVLDRFGQIEPKVLISVDGYLLISS